MKFSNHLDNFIDYLSTRNFSDLTIKSYRNYTKMFFQFLEENYQRIKQITQITKEEIADYSRYIRSYKTSDGKSLSNSTQSHRLTVIKVLFKFLVRTDVILKDPSAHLEMPRHERRLPRNILTMDEIKLILESIKLDHPVNIRNRAIIETFYSSGMRSASVTMLNK